MAAVLQRKNGLSSQQIEAFAPEQIIHDYAMLQWSTAIETAQYVYNLPKEKPKGSKIESRDMRIKRLAASENTTDRYAAMLVRRWDEEEREKPPYRPAADEDNE